MGGRVDGKEKLTVVVASNPASANLGLAMNRPVRMTMDFLTLKHIVEDGVEIGFGKDLIRG
jgi:hypothetical protein